jgi:FHA domain-containing protein
LTSSSSVASLVAVTKDAERALGGTRAVRVTQFPFKVGRESRVSQAARDTFVKEQRHGVAPQMNHLYLIEPSQSEMLQISRDHFTIERVGDRCFVVDRGSVCGTSVVGTRLGGHRTGGRTELRHGDQITVGTGESPYVFQFEIVPA